jgi:hypothetical protein
MSNACSGKMFGLRTKQLEYYESVHATNCNVIRVTETRLNDLYQDHSLFPKCYSFSIHRERILMRHVSIEFKGP